MRFELDSLSRRTGGRTILDGVSFAVESGGFCAVIGPTGCGKTTLLRTADLLVKPSSGRILLDGIDYAGAGSAACTRARRRMAMVMQRPFMLDGTVRRNVEAGLRFRGMKPDPGRIEAGLEVVGLSGFAGRHAKTLSGGEMQKVALARALATDPEILFLDEPLSSVDQGFRPEMRSLIASLHRGRGMTVVMATHDLADALALADHVAVLSEGRMIQHGPVDEVLLRPSNLFVASFSGQRNILRAKFEGTRAVSGGLEIVMAEPAEGEGCIVIPTEAVTVSASRPDSSMRNCFPGEVASIEHGPYTDMVSMVTGRATFVAAVTRESTERLGLHPGTAVWISFKANSVRILS